MLEPIVYLIPPIYKILTRDTIKWSGLPPSVKTQVHKLHIAESIDFVELQPASRVEHLKNIVNTLEIRESFFVVDAPIQRKGEIALQYESCRFVGIENALGQQLSQSECVVEITRSPGRPPKISIDTRYLLEKQTNAIIYVVSSTDDPAIFDCFLKMTRLANGDFKITPQRITLQSGVEGRVEYQGGCLYDPCFRGTQYDTYYNLDDEGSETIFYPLEYAIDLLELEWIYRINIMVEPELLQPHRADRVYSLGQLISRKGIVLTESGYSKKKLPNWDLQRAQVEVKILGEMPALPAGQEDSATEQ